MTDKGLEESGRGFYDMAFNQGEPAATASAYIGSTFVQHDPQVSDGVEPFIAFVTDMRSIFPEMHLEIKRVVAEGDMGPSNTLSD
jgi:predicted SnoaL-like aldol condensation-catalyzing enzyme